MPIKATCPDCGVRLSVPDHLAGKRIRCKKCGGPVPVPASEDPWEVEDVELATPIPAARPARPRKPKRRKPFPTKLVTLLGGGAAVLVGIFALAALVDWDKALGVVGMGRTERTMRKSVAIMEEFADTLATVTDAESARAAAPRLRACGEDLAEVMREETARAAARQNEIASLPLEEVQTELAEIDRLKAKYDPRRVAVQDRVKTEIERIRGIEGARDEIRAGIESFRDAVWDARMEQGKQRLEQVMAAERDAPPPAAFSVPNHSQISEEIRQRHRQASAQAQQQTKTAGAANTVTFVVTDVPFAADTRLSQRLKVLTGVTSLPGNAANGRWRFVVAPVSADIDHLAARVDFGEVIEKDAAGRVITIRWTAPPESTPPVAPPTEPAPLPPPPTNTGGFDV